MKVMQDDRVKEQLYQAIAKKQNEEQELALKLLKVRKNNVFYDTFQRNKSSERVQSYVEHMRRESEKHSEQHSPSPHHSSQFKKQWSQQVVSMPQIVQQRQLHAQSAQVSSPHFLKPVQYVHHKRMLTDLPPNTETFYLPNKYNVRSPQKFLNMQNFSLTEKKLVNQENKNHSDSESKHAQNALHLIKKGFLLKRKNNQMQFLEKTDVLRKEHSHRDSNVTHSSHMLSNQSREFMMTSYSQAYSGKQPARSHRNQLLTRNFNTQK